LRNGERNQGEEAMSKVAMVTGGTRGIGYAVVQRLKADGFKVAAGYAGNEEAAKACSRDLDVMVVKGNVGQFEDCARAVKEVETELGPIEVLVNNAGITRDAMLHKMTPD
jgi:acetoacetyl-CoA reductase